MAGIKHRHYDSEANNLSLQRECVYGCAQVENMGYSKNAGLKLG